VVWRTPRGAFQLLCHEMGHGNNATVGRMAWSEYGLDWTLSPVGAYTLQTEYSDGSSEYFCRRERPKLLLDESGHPTHLFTGILATKETCDAFGGYVDPVTCPGHSDDGSCGCQFSWTHAQPLGSGGAGGGSCVGAADCWGGGSCVDGSCVCDSWWNGDNCQVLALQPGAPPARQAYRRWSDRTSSWGGSPLKTGNSSYHLYLSEFDDGCGLNSWLPKSTVVHATASSPEGPYERQEVVVDEFHHNPVVVEMPDSRFLMMVIGQNASVTPINHASQFHIAAAVAPTLAGPWQLEEIPSLRNTSSGVPFPNGSPSNMHPYVFPNGTVLLLLRRAKPLPPPPVIDWELRQSANNVFGDIPDDEHVRDLGDKESAVACQSSCEADSMCTSYTWHDGQQGNFSKKCWSRIDGQWSLRSQNGHTTGRAWELLEGNNVWGESPDDVRIHDLGKQNSASACREACEAYSRCSSYTWHDSQQGSFASFCWARLDDKWSPKAQGGHVSGRPRAAVKIIV